MLRPIRTIVVAAMLGHSMPAYADIYQLVSTGGDNLQFVAYEVLDANGERVAQGRTDSLGRFVVNQKPGTYKLVAQWGRVALPAREFVIDGGETLKRIQVQIK